MLFYRPFSETILRLISYYFKGLVSSLDWNRKAAKAALTRLPRAERSSVTRI
jgi:hypothetical protein